MVRRPSEIIFDSSDPWKDDDLKRRGVGESLTAFLRSTQGPFVVAVQGTWGSGKSTFLRRLALHLEAQTPQIPVIIMDAWATDYLQDPLIAYIGAIRKRLERDANGKGLATAKRLVGALLKNGARLADWPALTGPDVKLV